MWLFAAAQRQRARGYGSVYNPALQGAYIGRESQTEVAMSAGITPFLDLELEHRPGALSDGY